MPQKIENSPEWKNYCEDVKSARMVLPEYEIDKDGAPIIYAGEIFCRVKDCPQAQHAYSSKNNMQKHVKSAHDLSFRVSKGGPASIKDLMAAKKFYRELANPTNPPKQAKTGKNEAESHAAPAARETLGGKSMLPRLYKKEDGTPDEKAIHKYGKAKLGGEIP